MRTRALLGTVALAALAMTMCVSALADGDTRPASPAEKACAGKTLGVLCGALPPPPAGWTVSGRSDTSPPAFVAGSSPRPMELVCEQSWQDRGKIQAAQSASMNAMMNAKEDPAAAANADAAQKKFEAVMAQITAAAQKNDQAALKRLQPEMDAASKAYQAAMQAKNKPLMDAVGKGKATDAEAKIRIEANARYEYLQVESQEVLAGGVTAYRVKPTGSEEGTTWVFLGPWQIGKDGSSTRFQINPLQGPPCAVVALRVRVDATPARAKAILEKVNWAALKNLLK